MKTQVMRRRLTVDEYERMGKAGILHEDERVELLDGELFLMAAVGSRHAACVKSCVNSFRPYPIEWFLISVQDPIRLSDFSEPEPDVALLRPRADAYAEAHPDARDVLLVIEVADTSLGYDRREKLPRYAEAGIPEVWIINLSRRFIEVHRDPEGNRFRQVSVFRRGERITLLSLPDVTIAVDDVLR